MVIESVLKYNKALHVINSSAYFNYIVCQLYLLYSTLINESFQESYNMYIALLYLEKKIFYLCPS